MLALSRSLDGLVAEIDRIPEARYYGRVATVLGMLVEVAGLDRHLSVGSRCDLVSRAGQRIPCEVVGFRGGCALAMSYGALEGVGLGRSEEHTSELQSLMRISYAVFCLKKKKQR